MALILFAAIKGAAEEPTPFQQPAFKVPDGFTVELAAGPPLVEHPIMAGFDDRGRLYVAENAGVNMQRKELEEKLPNSVVRLEDSDGDGRFDKRTDFADQLTFPQGALWADGWLYVASSGAIWRFRDKDDNGVAEVREKIVGSFGYTGNAADVHGCFLGPEGRIWWCEGRHGHDIVDVAGNPVSKGKAARIFSCRPDGSDVQIHCGGGMDNPVEIDWTDEGEMLGTVNIFYHKRGDCLVHWMHGGLYPRHDQPEVMAEFRRTGDPLDAVHDYGHVAVSGTCRVRGAGVSPARAEPSAAATFLVTEFNTHKIVRTDLIRDGSTFRAETADFLQAASDDFHPTDVLEDADGSFLVIDTGGWFRIGCPTSQIAKPNILGAIYRVRRTDAAKPADPRGLAIEWDELDGTQLAELLGDQRHAVRERAIATLARQGEAAVPYLSGPLAGDDRLVKRNAIWTLTRIGTPKAQGSVRLIGLADKDPSVLAAAVYSAGVTRDEAALDDLLELIAGTETPPQILREAATALGKIGSESAVEPILEALRRDTDRVLEHALIYALIEIADRDATAKGLADESPRVRRAALIALDQIPAGNLTRDEVAALLDTTDQPLLTAALDVISRRPGWSDELVALAGKLLGQAELSDSEQSLLSGALVGLAKDEKIQALVGEHLGRSETSETTRSLLLDVISRSDVRPLPAGWMAALKSLLESNRAKELPLAIAAAGATGDKELDDLLLALAHDPVRATETRLAALTAVADRKERLSAEEFDFVLQTLVSDSLVHRLSAVRLLAVTLSEEQSKKLNELASANPAVRELILRPNGSAASVVNAEQYRAKLEVALSDLPSGGVETGKQVFFGRKAACSTCHRVGDGGGKIGPDLSKVGERRNERDLVEAVLFPATSIARGFESQVIRTTDGRTLTGLVVRETAESLFLRTSDQREVRLRRNDIEAQKPSDQSIMPAGLENTMSRQELADLVAYLRSLK
jgi:putative membrane-bound dehydrogenase-like protein